VGNEIIDYHYQVKNKLQILNKFIFAKLFIRLNLLFSIYFAEKSSVCSKNTQFAQASRFEKLFVTVLKSLAGASCEQVKNIRRLWC